MKKIISKRVISMIFIFLISGCDSISNEMQETEENTTVNQEIGNSNNSKEVSDSTDELPFDYEFVGDNYISYNILEVYADLNLTEPELIYSAVVEEEYRITKDNGTFIFVKNAMNNKSFEGWVFAENLTKIPTGISEIKKPMNLTIIGINDVIGKDISEIESVLGTNYNVSIVDNSIQISYFEKGIVFLITITDRKIKGVIITNPVDTNLPVQIEDNFLESVEILNNYYGISEYDGGEKWPTRKFSLDNGYELVITANKTEDINVTSDTIVSVISILDFDY